MFGPPPHITIIRPKKCKKTRYAIGNVSMKDLSKIIRGVEKLPYKRYERRRSKHDTTDSYFYLAIHIVKCIMRSGAINLHIYPIRTEMTGMQQLPVFDDCSTYKSKSEEFLVEKTLSQVCCTD